MTAVAVRALRRRRQGRFQATTQHGFSWLYPNSVSLERQLQANLREARREDRLRLLPCRAVYVVLAEDGIRVQHVVEIQCRGGANTPDPKDLANPQIDLRQPVRIDRARGNQFDR